MVIVLLCDGSGASVRWWPYQSTVVSRAEQTNNGQSHVHRELPIVNKAAMSWP
uniref:Uncharacterized protein n=1 Tax=Triticum urartu TaxID=4572 RepID=A0A8R7PSQ7_TRIUA